MEIKITIVLGESVIAFKNRKRSILDVNTGKQRTLTPGAVKKHMQRIEDGIVSDLLFKTRTIGDGTDLEWRKLLRTALSGLSDDSLNEIPEFSFGVEYVEKGQEGVVIEIEEIIP